MARTNFFDSIEMKLHEVTGSFNKIFVYIVNKDKYTYYIQNFWDVLSPKEKKRAKVYYDNFLAERYIISHGILRFILGYYTNELPQNLNFSYNKYGKPFLKKSNVYFNMSHSHKVTCYAICINYKVGIDIEYCNKTIDLIGLLELVLTPDETISFQSCEQKDKYRSFYTLWTKKESLIKAIGQGLYYPINTIEALKLVSGQSIILANDSKKPDLGNLMLQEYELYNYILEVPSGYYGALSIKKEVNRHYPINKIVYFESRNQQGVFDNAIVRDI